MVLYDRFRKLTLRRLTQMSAYAHCLHWYPIAYSTSSLATGHVLCHLPCSRDSRGNLNRRGSSRSSPVIPSHVIVP